MATRQTVNRRRRQAWVPLLIGLAVLIALFLFNAHHPALFELAELKAADLRMYMIERPRPTGAVVIAAIDDKSIADLGHWPWPRSMEARLNQALAEYKAAVVGYDVLFSERDEDDAQAERILARLKTMGAARRAVEETLGAGNDAAFAEAIRHQGATYIAYAFQSHQVDDGSPPAPVTTGYKTVPLDPPPLAYGLVRELPGASRALMSAHAYLPPVPILNRAVRGIGYVDIGADADGVMRSELTVIRFGKRYCVPLYLALVAAYRNNAPLSLAVGPDGIEQVAVGSERIPVDEIGGMIVDFRGPPGTFATYSVSDIIARRVPPAALAGKLVLVGMTAHALGDRVVTPVGADFPGVEVHANAIDNVLRGDFVQRSRLTDAAEEEVAAAIMVLAISLTVAYLSPLSSAAIWLWVMIGFVGYAQYCLTRAGILINVVMPLAASSLTYVFQATYLYITEGRAKKYVRNALEHYLNPDVVASVVDDPAGLRLGGERRHLAILFADIVNFTARAERYEPERLVALLNSYMTEMTRIIFESQGVVDKLMGDGIMAFWGAPKAIANPARAAIDCALSMLEGLARLRRTDERFADVDIGIGVATGEAIVGNLGSEQRFDYSAVGDTVNLAARLEGLTRHFGVHLLVNRQTVLEADSNYCGREVGLVKVKGKEQLVPIVDVAGRAGNGIDASFYQRFNQALEHVRKGNASAAVATLRALNREAPDDALVNLYLEKLEEAVDGQPTEMVFEFETK
jgi:adenylate cyclase